ncbi:tRNA pseudouridine(38-40) synthase TruA [Alkalibacterium olivapovliticus]|uniref:tRNA pseudouridine synthase A n=1 Tax=Alkalibacterium olivapovliticus TaxID=99907 RepID=A0A2T0W6U2_9LACT|nr:tRNA pseudouridine(38-40) synthase TruA [Alkalibacterium olivapovliticus]PRY82430.1 tRNA pseudouridine38-40 synthase [Alkalibacterium olivapovliticus]
MKNYRYKAILAYDGTDFAGFQVQKNARTVQGELEKVLSKIAKGEKIRVHGSGRTDAGVHARGQVIHFDFPFYIEPDGMQKALNGSTTKEITFTHVEQAADDFHSRYQAKGKMYKYTVDNNRFRDPFLRHFSCHHRYPMAMDPIQKALPYLTGKHDFTSFASTHGETAHNVRTIYHVRVEHDAASNKWTFTFVGNGFLYNMIRILMGTLLEVADGRRPASDIPLILEAKDREAAGKTSSPEGLCMEKVFYDVEDIPGYTTEGD